MADRGAENTATQETLNEMYDLAARLREKAETLDALADRQDHSRSHYVRLQGKAEGVRLALSFVEEITRGR